jgi:glycosyltransferase involved in cell wall biosynthesis
LDVDWLETHVKVLIPTLRSDSGSDVYCQDIKEALSDGPISVEIVRLAPFLELAPYIAKATLFWRSEWRRCSLVHTNADYGTAFKAPGKPYVVTAHHDVFDALYQKCTSGAQKAYHYGLLKRRIARALTTADKVVAVSHSTKASLERTFGVTKIEVIYNGIDTEVFKPRPAPIPDEFRKKVRLLFVGNLIKRKGADLLPEIMTILGAHYVLFHTGGSEIGQANTVSLGRVAREQLPDIYNMCDVFLFPSRLEGFGYAVAEAMACGKPVVCTDCSSLPELVVDKKGGFLCEQDNVKQFAEKIRVLAGDPALRTSMGEFNRKRIVENFTLGKMADGYSRLYRDVLRAESVVKGSQPI